MVTINPVFGPKADEESHKLDVEIDVDADGDWYTKYTCPKCPEYILLKWAGGNKKDRLKTVEGIHHWFNGTYTKHLEKN